MRALIDLIIKNKHWFLFILLEVISLVFLFSYNGYQKSVYFTTANDVVGTTYNVISGISSYIHLQEENRNMEAANEELRKEVYELRQQLDALQKDSVERMPALPSQYHTVPAQVVNSTLHKANNLITINKGEADGIRPEMGVICSSGIVGIVYMTSLHYSIVMPLLNVNSKVSCRLRESEYFGSLIWERGYANVAYATSIPRHAKVKKNDIVETNGYSDIFPPGLPIGIVTGIDDSSDGMSYRLKVRLFADFPTLREVSVITDYFSPERRLLEDMAIDPAKQDSVLISQEKKKAEEEAKRKEEQEKRQKAEEDIIKAELEKKYAETMGAQTSDNQKTEKTDTVR
ncbi:MAG: rod shape-determining protein MreC [Bacteroidaceae bacterium]|nr:rod shape-determining protein MreC [Bacteroidaceae bacterium]